MKKSKKTIAIFIAALLCLSLLAACGGGNNATDNENNNTSNEGAQSTNTGSNNTNSSNSSPNTSISPPTASVDVAGTVAPPSGDTVKFADEIMMIIDNSVVSVMNPFLPGAGSPANGWTYNMIYDRLIYPVAVGQYDPYLATRWETDDYQTFTFYLREDVYFQNGEKFTANDVVWTVNTAKESVGSGASTQWSYVKEATAIDEYTVQLVLNNVNVDFLFFISNSACGIVNEKAMKDDPENGARVGTGAYRITEFVADNYWVLERNDNYWGDPPITRKVTMTFIPEMGTRTIMMLNGEAQISFRISDEDLQVFIDDPGFNVNTYVLNNPNPIWFNLTHPICGNYDFRMAVASALDREEIAMGVAGDYALDGGTDGSYWGYGSEFRNTSIPVVPYDLEAAKKYLEASPYNGEVIEIATSNASLIKASEIVQQQLNRIGLKTEIQTFDGPGLNIYGNPENSQVQMSVSVVGMSLNASSFRNTVYPGTSSNRTFYNNPAVTELLDRAAGELDYEKRREIWMEVQRLIAEDPPFFNLFWRLSAIVADKGVGGFTMPADAAYDLRYMYWQIEG